MMAGSQNVSTPPEDQTPGTTPPGNNNPPSNDNPPGNTPGGGGGGNDYLKEQRRQQARAARRAEAQAKILERQAAALRVALGKAGFKRDLKRQLKNVRLVFNENDAQLLKDYRIGMRSLQRNSDINTDVRARESLESLANAGRERAEAMMQGVANGIGASDLIRAQMASLRNWSSNQAEVQQNYVDSQESVRSSRDEMYANTLTQRQQAWRGFEEGREMAYDSYYDRRSDALTEIGNKLGDAATYWDLANEQQGSKKRRQKARALENRSIGTLRKASREIGKGYTQRDAPNRIANWKGGRTFENNVEQQEFLRPTIEVGRAEGATLRRWEQ